MSKRNEREFLMTTMSSEAIWGRRGSTWARFLPPPHLYVGAHAHLPR